MSHVLQALVDAGINAFAAELLAESLLKSPVAKAAADRGEPLRFFFPVQRTDCPGWIGVDFVLVAVPVGAEQGTGPYDAMKGEVKSLRAKLTDAARTLQALRRAHYVLEEDCYYSCPASGRCCRDDAGDKCTCGADEVNAKIDAALKAIEKAA